jgi:hypothetical protein
MSHVLSYDGHYFRVDVVEVVNADDPGKASYVGWCSDGFRELKDLPSQSLSRFIAGPPLASHAEALRHTYDWIKVNWDAQLVKRPRKVGRALSLLYTVWLFRGDGSTDFDFEEFAEATAFAKAAEKSVSITKVGVTNNESPQYLTVWERPKP